MITRNDVARRAGVSTAVVSYVVNDGPRPVAAETRLRVQAAMAELHYRPNAVARSLKTRRTGVIGLILPDTANSYFAQLLREVELAAAELGFALLVANSMSDPAREQSYAHAFLDRRVDGVVLVCADPDTPVVDVVAGAGVPLVTVDRGTTAAASTVRVDNVGGGELATRHLVEHGHRRIAVVQGPSTLPNAVDRRTGWAKAMTAAGLPVPRDLVGATDGFSRRAAYDAAVRLLSGRRPPTAVFATADEHALGVYRAARATGRRVPDDLAVVSFDSAETAPYLVPGLTAVRQPVAAMAALAVRRLVEQLAEQLAEPPADGPAAPTEDVFDVDLVLRGSCGCPDPEPTSRDDW